MSFIWWMLLAGYVGTLACYAMARRNGYGRTADGVLVAVILGNVLTVLGRHTDWVVWPLILLLVASVCLVVMALNKAELLG